MIYIVRVKGKQKQFVRCSTCGASLLKKNLLEHQKTHTSGQ